MKRCSCCGETKPLDEFHRRSATGDGRQSNCRLCNNARLVRTRRNDRARAVDAQEVDPDAPDLRDGQHVRAAAFGSTGFAE